MKHLFIPFALALTAKEKGFNEPCIAEFTVFKDEQRLNLNNHLHTNENIQPNVPAPLYQQLIDWMRFDKGIHFKEHTFGITVKSQFPDISFTERNVTKDEHFTLLNKAIKEAFNLIK